MQLKLGKSNNNCVCLSVLFTVVLTGLAIVLYNLSQIVRSKVLLPTEISTDLTKSSRAKNADKKKFSIHMILLCTCLREKAIMQRKQVIKLST